MKITRNSYNLFYLTLYKFSWTLAMLSLLKNNLFMATVILGFVFLVTNFLYFTNQCNWKLPEFNTKINHAYSFALKCLTLDFIFHHYSLMSYMGLKMPPIFVFFLWFNLYMVLELLFNSTKLSKHFLKIALGLFVLLFVVFFFVSQTPVLMMSNWVYTAVYSVIIVSVWVLFKKLLKTI